MAAEKKESANDEAREMVEREKRYRSALRRYHDAIGVEYDFSLKLKQLNPTTRRELERKGKQAVVALDLTDIVRYKAAKLTGEPIYLDVKLASPGKSDAETAAWEDTALVARGVMNDQIHDLDIGYPAIRRKFVKMGIAARAGAAKLEVEASGPYGCEIVPSHMDPRNLAWDGESYAHFNDYGCPELWETITPLLSWVKAQKGWSKEAQNLRPDDGEKIIQKIANPTVDKPTEPGEDGQRVTLKVGWIKCDEDEVEVEVREPVALPSNQWHMACSTCGYSEADLVNTPGYDGSTLPESYPCPQCGTTPEGQPVSQMHRIDMETELGRMPAFNDKHRKVIVSAFMPELGILHESPWPKGLTNFPYLMFVPDPFPLEPMGNSDTFYNMDLQALKNQALRLSGEQFERNRDMLVAKEDSLWDANHEPYQFDGTGDFVAYAESYEDLQGIKHFQGAGLNQAASAWIGILNEELGAHRGIGEVSLTAEQMKGTNVGTVAQAQESGDVPIDECQRILRETEEPFWNRWLELIVAHWDEGRWVNVVGKDGSNVWRLFSGNGAPPMKLKVNASPNMSAVDRMQIDTVKSLQGAPPSVIRMAGQAANLPKDMIDELIQSSMAAMGPATTGGPPPPNAVPAGMSPAG